MGRRFLPALPSRARLSWGVLLVVALSATGLPVTPTVAAVPLVVTAADDVDDGSCDTTHCSLREALLAANAQAGADMIAFDLPTTPATITPTVPLPAITDPVVLDATTQPGFAGAPVIELSGAAIVGTTTDATVALTLEGGSSTVRGLVINRFETGIVVDGAVGGNRIVGNWIGTDLTGTSAFHVPARSGYSRWAGIDLRTGDNTVGGTVPADRNVVSGNAQGVLVRSDGNVVAGNYVGSDATGTASVPNGLPFEYQGQPRFAVTIGISVGGHNNTIGGTLGVTPGGACTGACNLVVGEDQDQPTVSNVQSSGVHVSGSDNTIAGNLVGLDVTGTARFPFERGVAVYGSRNTIGGPTSTSGNVVSGHTWYGVLVDSWDTPALDNVIRHNVIGPAADRTTAVENDQVGVGVLAQENTGSTLGTMIVDNLISGNGDHGVQLGGNGAIVQGNRIGTDPTGTAALPNGAAESPSGAGIALTMSDWTIYDPATDNLIGGSGPGEGNLISGNAGPGITGIAAQRTTIQGNHIGVDVTGTAALPNSSGIALDAATGPWGDTTVGSTADNVIGGSEPGAGNLVSGNERYGIYLGHGERTTIAGNLVGTDVTGLSPLGNGLDGIALVETKDTTVGQPWSGNVVSGNGRVGVFVAGEDSTGNVLEGNWIGSAADATTPMGNGDSGVRLEGEADENRIGGPWAGEDNTIAFNGLGGIRIGSGIQNRIEWNRIHDNVGLGIDLGGDGVTPNDPADGDAGPNALQNHPVLTSATAATDGTSVTGTLDSMPYGIYWVHLYTSPTCDPSGHGEGTRPLWAVLVTADELGHGSFSWSGDPDVTDHAFVTATATDEAGNTSEFSACLALAPQADAGGPYGVAEGEAVVLDGGGSSGPGGIDLFEWDLDEDGTFDVASSEPTTTHTFLSAGTHVVALRVTDAHGGTDTDTAEVTVTNVAPDVVVTPSAQTVQYGDGIVPIEVSATDVGDDHLTHTTRWRATGEAWADGLPPSLGAAETCSASGGVTSCVWTISGAIGLPAGAYEIESTVTDDDGGATTTTSELTVTAEQATVAFDPSNPASVPVDDGEDTASVLTLTTTVVERNHAADQATGTPSAGDIATAEVAMALVPIGPGGMVTPDSCTRVVTGTGYDQVLAVTCTFADVEVNTYAVEVTVDGGHYTGGGQDVVTVHDPDGGFTVGGGWFAWPDTGDRTTFGFTMKHTGKNAKVRGSLLVVRHLPDGSTYWIKSNALDGLAVGDGPGDTDAWATFHGRATHLEPGWDEPIGNHEFVVSVTDRGKHGSGTDTFQLLVDDQANEPVVAMTMDGPAAVSGGDIAVPHAAGKKHR